jgi:hypothetical protein
VLFKVTFYQVPLRCYNQTYTNKYLHSYFCSNLPYELTSLWYDRFLQITRIGVSRILGLKNTQIKLFTHLLEGNNIQINPKFLSKGLGILLMRQRYKKKTGQRKKTFLHPPARYNWWEKNNKRLVFSYNTPSFIKA